MLRRILKPSFSDLLFLSLICWLFMMAKDGWSLLLLDGDTGWHIRVGEYILKTGSVPQKDLFSFSKPGEPWFAWEWGSDVIFALLFRTWGLKGIVIFGGVLVALFATLLVRLSLWRGANPLFTLAIGLIAVGASTVHYLARPHLFTLVFIPLAVWILERDETHRDRVLWLLVPLAAVWTNLHGGFLALIAIIGIAAVGSAIEAYWRPDPDGWDRARRLAIVGALCGLATFVNPYGYHLHMHISSYLQSDWIKEVVSEFKSPSFRQENIMQYEVLLLTGLLAAALRLSRKSVVASLWILFWAHQSLVSVRHITIYVSIAAPVIALELTMLWRKFTEGAHKASVRAILDSLANDTLPNFRWTSAWPVLAVVALFGLHVSELDARWPKDFPPERFPIKIISKHEAKIRPAKVLTEDQWADYLIYRFYPEHKVFFDGRSDFYGAKLGREYMGLTGGRHDWRQILDKHGFDVALVPVEWPLTTLLKQQPDWKVIEDDGKALLFERTRKREIASTR
ncbi:MAG: hypothetical protein U0Q16_08465 [Bryobacteraceae bacterium]